MCAEAFHYPVNTITLARAVLFLRGSQRSFVYDDCSEPNSSRLYAPAYASESTSLIMEEIGSSL